MEQRRCGDDTSTCSVGCSLSGSKAASGGGIHSSDSWGVIGGGSEGTIAKGGVILGGEDTDNCTGVNPAKCFQLVRILS